MASLHGEGAGEARAAVADAAPEMATEVVIVGAGPAGLFAIFQCGMLGLACHVVDALPAVGGQCAALYPEKPIYDIPAYPELAGGALIESLARQAAPFRPVYDLGQVASTLSGSVDEGFVLATASGTRIRAKAVIVASGAGLFRPNRPPLPGIEGYEGGSVHYAVTRREAFHGKRVVIAGGGDSAVDWALALSGIAAAVQLVHRRARFRAEPAMCQALERAVAAGRIETVVPFQLAALEGDGRELAAVVGRALDGETRRLAADRSLLFFGLATDPAAAANGGVPVDPATMATSRPGVFAIGDAAAYPGKLKLILCGFAEAAMAAQAVYAQARPDQPRHFEHSTSRGVPRVA